MNRHAATEGDHPEPARSSRRAVLGLALGATLGGIGLPVGLAAAKPVPKRPATPKRQAKSGGRRNGKARRGPKRKPAPRFKIVTRTFASTAPITIPASGAASPYPSSIPVGGLRAGSILDVNVALAGFSHKYPKDAEVVLVAPTGQAAVVLMSEVGGGYEVTNVTLGFDDQAASFLPFDAQIVSGTFKPTSPGAAPGPDTASLHAFTGLNPNGAWRLYVANGEASYAGSLAAWALTITARVRI